MPPVLVIHPQRFYLGCPVPAPYSELHCIPGVPSVRPLTLTENDFPVELVPARGLTRIDILDSRDWAYELRSNMLPVRRPFVPQCPLETTATVEDPCRAAAHITSQENLLSSPTPSMWYG